VTAASAGGPVLGGSSPVHIYLIFWGKYWDSSEGRSVSDQMLSTIDPVLNNNTYLDSLHQYGVKNRAYNDPRFGTGQGAVVDSSDPQDGFTSTDVEAVVARAINDGVPFASDNLYFVVTRPGVSSDSPITAAYHAYDTVRDRASGQFVPLYFGWIGNDGTLDHFTRFLSHEVVEAMTDPHRNAWQVSPAPDPHENEIADNEAQLYAYRINGHDGHGYLVQAYWSQQDGQFRVNDGTSQNFYVQKDPNVFTDVKYQLVINGDQLGYGYNDTIVIYVNAAGGVSVNLNGEIVSFDPDMVSSIIVNTGAGANSVFVLNMPQGVDVTVNDGGDDYVSLGSQGSVQGILGSVQINNPFNHTQLVINDSADLSAQTVYMDDHSVIGLAPGNIGFNSDGLSFLTIYGGSGGNTFYVFNTPSTATSSYTGYTWINSGAGIDVINIVGTTGNLYLNGQSGHDYVYLGTDSSTPSPMPGNGTLADIHGFVYVYNPSGVTSLFVDDAADSTGHTATLNSNSLAGLSAGKIYWTPTSLSYTGGVDELHIYGSAASSTYYVTDTPNLYFGTDLRTGIGNDALFINGTSGFLGTYNRGGFDSVYVGNGTVAGINGSVSVAGAGSTNLIVQDYLDTTAHSATLAGNYLMGLSNGTIWWTPSATATGGVTYLSILDGAGSSTFVVNDTSNLFYYTNLNTGAGNDTVFITGTTGSLFVNNPDGYDSVYVGSGGTLANVNGSVNVSGNGSTYLYVMDYNDTTSHTATLTATSLTGLSRGAIQWVPTVAATGGVTFLDIWGSAAGSTYNITDTPSLYYYTDLNTGAGDDNVFITGTTGALYLYNGGGADTVVIGRKPPATTGGKVAAINGMVDVYGAGTVALTVDDSGDTNGRAATLTSYSLTGLAPAAIYFGTDVTALTITGGNGNDTLTVADLSSTMTVTFNGGNGGDRLVGPNTSSYWDITGTNAGNVAGLVKFVNVENLVGGTGVDTFWFEPAARLSSINGGGAPAGQGDWLDYANYSAAVSVNLATGKATGVAGTIGNIQNVFGGNHGNTLTGNAQGNILIGGDAADTIIGGTGRSLLIGGKGNDTIKGGSADDIVIGGYTAYDSAWHEAALMSILAEWQSADSFATRVSSLRSSYNPLAFGTTVFDDGGTDKLTGGGGMDWFFAGIHSTISDYQGGEVVN
jgi:hypothetical protein